MYLHPLANLSVYSVNAKSITAEVATVVVVVAVADTMRANIARSFATT